MAFKMRSSPMARNYGAPFTNNETGNKESDTSEADAIAAKAIEQNKGAVDRRTQRINKKFTEFKYVYFFYFDAHYLHV